MKPRCRCSSHDYGFGLGPGEINTHDDHTCPKTGPITRPVIIGWHRCITHIPKIMLLAAQDTSSQQASTRDNMLHGFHNRTCCILHRKISEKLTHVTIMISM